MDIDDEDVFKELDKIDNTMGPLKNKKLAPVRDLFGKFIEDIPYSQEQKVLLDNFPEDEEDELGNERKGSQMRPTTGKTRSILRNKLKPT